MLIISLNIEQPGTVAKLYLITKLRADHIFKSQNT